MLLPEQIPLLNRLLSQEFERLLIRHCTRLLSLRSPLRLVFRKRYEAFVGASVMTASLKKAHCFSSPNKVYGVSAALSNIYVISSLLSVKQKYILFRINDR